MLVLYRIEKRWEDRMFRDLPQFLGPGDCLVLNDSKVFPSRLYGKRVGFSGAVEVLLVQPVSEDALNMSFRCPDHRDLNRFFASSVAGI